MLRLLREDPGLIPAAVEELLCFAPPAQATFRRAFADCEVGGFGVRKRDNVVALVGAANRGPEVFDDPYGLDYGRAPAPT